MRKGGILLKRYFFRSIFVRYILSYAVLILVLFLGIGIYAINGFDTATRRNIVDSNINRLAVLRVEHEEKLNTLLNICNQISLSPYITPFKLREDPMKAYHLKQQLASFNVANNFISQVYLTFIGDEYLYSSATSVSIENFTERMVYYEYLGATELAALLRSENTENVFLPSQQIRGNLINEASKKTLTVIMPVRLDGKFTIGNLLFYIQDESYQKMFHDEVYESRDMYLFQNGIPLTGSERLPIPASALAEEVNAGTGNFHKELTIEGETYILFVQQGSLFELRYASLIPVETVYSQTVRNRLAFCIFLFLFSIPCLLLVVYVVRRQVRPIQELQNSFGSNTNAEDSFSVIRNGIESLIGQNMVLNTRLNESLLIRRADFAKNFVKKRFESREKVLRAAEILQLPVDRRYFMVSILAADLGDRYDPDSLYRLAGNKEEIIGCGVDIVSQEQTLLILFSDGEDSLREWARTARDALAAIDRDATVAVSSIYEDFLRADTAYLEACAAYDNRFVMGIERVLSFEDVSVSGEDVDGFIRGYLDAFRKALHANDSEALSERINELFQTLSERQYSIFSFRLIFNELVNTLQTRHSLNASPNTLQYYDIFSLSRCRRISDLNAILQKLCDDILSTAKIEEEPSLSQEITAYMRAHYTDPALSMGAVAETFGISTTQLSLIYKKQTGIHPSAYLLVLRMEHAKELLSSSNLSVKEISILVGYYDASGFIRRFKQHTSMTPIQYRQSTKKNIAEE